MRHAPRRNRHAFRPTLGDGRLEDRVVLNGTALGAARASAVGSASEGLGDVTNRSLAAAYRQQFRDTQTALRNYVGQQASDLFDASNLGPDGRPTREALADFSASVAGALNAVTYGTSAQASLLPGADRRLVAALQDSFQGSRNGSLANQIARQVDSGRFLGSERAFQASLDRRIDATFANNSSLVTDYLRGAPLNRLAVDPATGQRVALSQYLGDRAAQQINAALGALSNNVGSNARTSLLDASGAFNPQGAGTFQQQYANALSTAAFQANNVLSVLPNSSSLRSQLQSNFFGAAGDAGAGSGTGIGTGTGAGAGAGTGNLSFYNALVNVVPSSTGPDATPFNVDDFETAFRNNFTTAYQNFATPLNSFLGASTSVGTDVSALPTGFFQSGATFPSVFGTQYTGTGFNSGFNNGFVSNGTGFPGFGTAPTGFNTAFGTGFTGFIGNLNQQFGLTQPSGGVLAPGVGSPTGSIGVGTGVTTPTTGIGGVTTPTTGLGGVTDPTAGLGGTAMPTTGTGGTTTTDVGLGIGGSSLI